MSKWRWWAAALLFISIAVASKVGQPSVQQAIHRIVYSSQDLMVVRTALQQTFLHPEQIAVATKASTDALFLYQSIEPYDNGVLLTYEQPITVQAFFDGLIIFTGYTKYTNKTMTILYSEGTTVTYGFIDELMRLPYTALRTGDVIVPKQQSALYISMERNGVVLKMEDIVMWLEAYRT